ARYIWAKPSTVTWPLVPLDHWSMMGMSTTRYRHLGRIETTPSRTVWAPSQLSHTEPQFQQSPCEVAQVSNPCVIGPVACPVWVSSFMPASIQREEPLFSMVVRMVELPLASTRRKP